MGSQAARAALLFLGAALLSGIALLDGVQPNDEGLMLQAAARIADGQVPYEDFWWFYPPGQPYLLGGLWELFGPSLLPWRIVRVLCDAAVALLVWLLALRGGASPKLALEFAWAEEMLETAVEKAEAAGKAAKETSRKQRIIGAIAIALGVAAAVFAAIAWDIPLLPV